MEGNPPEGAGAGRARADTAEGNVSTINIVDLRNSRKQGGFEKFLPLLKSRAKRFLYSGRDYDELVNAGAVGLGEAIANYRQGSNNGLAAFAIPHIDGAIRRFCNKSYWTVPGERNERGKHLPIASRIEHFGNVAIGDGSYKPDVSINAEIASDGEHGDDEAGGGTFLDEVVDRSLEDITGDRWWRIEQRLSERESRILLGKRRRLTNKEIGGELGVSGEAVRQALAAITKKLQREKFDLDKFSWPDHDALMFRREFEEYCRKGIGHLYRSRRQPKMSRNWGAIPNADWMTHKKHDPHCICMTCCPTKLGPAEYYLHHGAVLKTFERAAAGWAPKKTNSKDPSWISTALGYSTGAAKDDDRGPQAWTGWSKWKRAPQPEWKMKARSLPGLALPKETRPVLDWMVLRHVEYKGIPLEKPVRPIRSKRAKVKRHKSPALPPELHFLSPSGVREWKKAAKRSPLPHRGEWSLPYIADIERRWRDTVEVVETADGPASRTVMPPAPVCNSLFAPDPALKKLIAEIVDDLTPTPPVRSRTRFDNPETPSATDWWAREFKTRMSLEEFMNQQPQRKKPWSKPTVSTLASLCYSSDVSLTPLPPPPVTTTADRPLTSAKLLQRNSSATA